MERSEQFIKQQSDKGKKGGRPKNPRLNPRLNHGKAMENPWKSKPQSQEELYNSIGTESGSKRANRAPESKRIRKQQNPPAEAHKLKEYQIEVLNKCEGKLGESEHPSAGLLYRIGEEVPREIVFAALEQLQDKRQDRLGDSDRPKVENLTRYYLGTVRSMCAEKNIETTINWKKSKLKAQSLSDVLDEPPAEEAST